VTSQLRSSLLVSDTITEALFTIAERPVRTLLTALGTILGVGAFIVTTGLAATARAQVSSRFDAIKATEVQVRDTSPDGTDPFPTDVDSSLLRLNGVRSAGEYFNVPNTLSNLDVRAALSPSRSSGGQPIAVVAATPGAIRAALPTLTAGRLYEQWHEQRGERVVLLGGVAANQLGITRIDSRPVVFIGETAFTVIGILSGVERNPSLLLSAIIPLSTAERRFDVSAADRHVLIDTSPGAAQLIGGQAPYALRPEQPDRLQALIPPDPKTLRNQVEGDVQSLFYALAVLALLIGAIAIMNATLLNVIERRAEIGLRRSLGATRPHISRQVTLEAALTGTMGGIIGGSLGVIAVVGISAIRGWTPIIQPVLLLASPVLGVATGALAGLIPAIRAARTSPAETLRT
jgi:putative ABC transport system permease protein